MRPIFIFDFDGVIVDGILEYWASSRESFLELIKDKKLTNNLPIEIPQAFLKLRPWVKYGWEMLLITAELTRSNSPINISGPMNFLFRISNPALEITN